MKNKLKNDVFTTRLVIGKCRAFACACGGQTSVQRRAALDKSGRGTGAVFRAELECGGSAV